MEKKETTLREILESDSYAKQRAIIQAEINENKVEIDRTVFSKTTDEWIEAETAKYQWRQQIQKQGFSKRSIKQKIYFKS